jgi:hypothetical protein
MTTKELIEKQVKEAVDTLRDLGPTFDRPREISNGIAGVANACERLLQIVQNQQAQIERLEMRGRPVIRAEIWCECGHSVRIHTAGVGVCNGDDDAGEDCECTEFREEERDGSAIR